MKEDLEVAGNIPDFALAVGETQAEAIRQILETEWRQAYWVEGKSKIRIRKIMPLFDMGEHLRLIETHELNRVIAGPSSFDQIFKNSDNYISYARPEVRELPEAGLTLDKPKAKKRATESRRRPAAATEAPKAGGRARRKRSNG